jgi:hypothetical protein
MSPDAFLRTALSLAAALVLGACASARGPAGDAHGLHPMPADPARAMPPGAADPDSAAELAEAALHLLYPDRPGGPDYTGAARLCLISAELADPSVEERLQLACYRTAARSALRAGERDLYEQAVELWELAAPRHERATGELAAHLAIRDRLSGTAPATWSRLSGNVRRLIPFEGGGK